MGGVVYYLISLILVICGYAFAFGKDLMGIMGICSGLPALRIALGGYGG